MCLYIDLSLAALAPRYALMPRVFLSQTCAADIVAAAIDGFNGTILAYGQVRGRPREEEERKDMGPAPAAALPSSPFSQATSRGWLFPSRASPRSISALSRCFQTGAGKTFTISGGAGGGYQQRGLIPRAVSGLGASSGPLSL